MGRSRFDICNRALAELRVPPITSFEDGTTPAIVAGQVYDGIVEDMTGGHRWTFCKKQMTLVRETTPPKDRWEAFYTLPSNLFLLYTVTLDDEPIEYDRFGNSIACHLGIDDVPVAEYAIRIDEAYWPAYFATLVQWRLYIAFAGGVAGKESFIAIGQGELRKQWLDAKRLDAQAKTTKALPRGRRLLSYR